MGKVLKYCRNCGEPFVQFNREQFWCSIKCSAIGDYEHNCKRNPSKYEPSESQIAEECKKIREAKLVAQQPEQKQRKLQRWERLKKWAEAN